jgi:hypothetical protein
MIPNSRSYRDPSALSAQKTAYLRAGGMSDAEIAASFQLESEARACARAMEREAREYHARRKSIAERVLWSIAIVHIAGIGYAAYHFHRDLPAYYAGLSPDRMRILIAAASLPGLCGLVFCYYLAIVAFWQRMNDYLSAPVLRERIDKCEARSKWFAYAAIFSLIVAPPLGVATTLIPWGTLGRTQLCLFIGCHVLFVCYVAVLCRVVLVYRDRL